LNPIEQVWQYLQRRLRWQLPTSLDELRQHLRQLLEKMTFDVIASIAGRHDMFEYLICSQYLENWY
jgi:hypothetical protein